MNDAQRKEFEDITRPVIKWMCENIHPHATTIITPTSAELLEGVIAFTASEYVLD